MSESKKKEIAWGSMLRRAVLSWLLAAVLCLLLAALLVEKGLVPYMAIGYLGSAMSFITAVFAAAGMGGSAKGGLLSALAVSLCLVILLLTVGFLISNGALDPAGILSVSTFTIAGFLCGNLLFDRKSRRSKPGIYSVRRK